MNGFGSHFVSEHPDYPNALPKCQNNPQKCAYGLYAEQLSGTAFTAPRHSNQRTWFYRIRPSVLHEPYQRFSAAPYLTNNWADQHPNPNQMRWKPFELNDNTKKCNFVEGIHTVCGAGEPKSRHGISIHIYLCNQSMTDCAFYNSDGDFLIGSYSEFEWEFRSKDETTSFSTVKIFIFPEQCLSREHLISKQNSDV